MEEKIADHEVEIPEEVIEALVEHMVGGNVRAFAWDNGKAETQRIEIKFTEDDEAKLANAIDNFVKKMPDTIHVISKVTARQILNNLKKDWPEWSLYERVSLEEFQESLRREWDKAFKLLKILHAISFEIGQETLNKVMRSKSTRNKALRSVLIHLHARSCQIVSEILVLLESGYADGAMARWRTLYEIGVVGAVIAAGGENLAQRYLEHEAVESKFALDRYEECREALGYRPLGTRQKRELGKAYDAVVTKYGAAFGKPNGWAADYFGKKKVDFLGRVIS